MRRPHEVFVRVVPVQEGDPPAPSAAGVPGGFWALAGAELIPAPPPQPLPWRRFWAAQHHPPQPTGWAGYELRLLLKPDAPPRLTLWVSVFAPDDVQADLEAEERLRWALDILPQGFQGRWLNREEIAHRRDHIPPFVGVLSREPEGRYGAFFTDQEQAEPRPPFPAPWRPSGPEDMGAERRLPLEGPLWVSLAVSPTVLLPAEGARLAAWIYGLQTPAAPALTALGRAWWRRYQHPFLARLRVGAASSETLFRGLHLLRSALLGNASTAAWVHLPQTDAQHRQAQVNWRWGTLHPWEATPRMAPWPRLPHLFTIAEVADLTHLLIGGVL